MWVHQWKGCAWTAWKDINCRSFLWIFSGECLVTQTSLPVCSIKIELTLLQFCNSNLCAPRHIEQDWRCTYSWTYDIALWRVRVMLGLYLLRYHNNLILFHSKRALLWRFDVASKNKTYSSLQVNCRIVTELGISQHISIKGHSIKLSTSSSDRADTCGHDEGNQRFSW